MVRRPRLGWLRLGGGHAYNVSCQHEPDTVSRHSDRMPSHIITSYYNI